MMESTGSVSRAYRTQSLDTSVKAERVLVEAYRRMSPREKLRCVDDLIQASMQFARAGIKTRYPNATEREIRLRLGVLRFGLEAMVRAFGWDAKERGY